MKESASTQKWMKSKMSFLKYELEMFAFMSNYDKANCFVTRWIQLNDHKLELQPEPWGHLIL